VRECCKYNAGDLRQVVVIESKTRAANGSGGFDVAWAAVTDAPTRAMITAAPGSERWNYMRQASGNTFKMVTRWFSGASAAQRVTSGGKEYGVLGVVDPDGFRRWLEWRISDGVPS
jgi:head-tail adaptor